VALSTEEERQEQLERKSQQKGVFEGSAQLASGELSGCSVRVHVEIFE
jgi:hypothetical protein